MKINPDILKLYAITDGDSAEDVESALQGGVTCIQLRNKTENRTEIIRRGVEIKKICRKYNVPFIVNDDYKIALECGADGVHVGISDTPVAEIRKATGADFIIGATAKTIEQAEKAQADGADYLGVGAVFPSPTKTDAIRITPENLKEICSNVKIPVVAIGGITADNLHIIDNCGQCGIAVVSAVFGQQDIKSSAERLRAEL